ncbi:TetR/AcrR family transcriptional regulator [Blastococcus sp. Marseille-P5729]|uniref:TetR/AcrR family transcriptional regulator n=1 Tax=Blastococcus sp. Marseille-P5729 TaxID=2086582 RepID=UPI000D0EDD4C|nr:TetR/AcrR family transcriptional regulator [Blastococcus sp. Marseille-P5729]
MPKVSEEHRSAQRARIDAAVIACIERTGLVALTMADIIKESGLSAGAIYGYYPGKKELTVAVAHSVLGNRLAVLDEVAGRDPLPAPATVLAELLRGMPAPILLQLFASTVSSGELKDVAHQAIARVDAGISSYLVTWFERQGVPTAEAKRRAALVTPAMLGLAQGYVIQSGVRLDLELDDYIAAIEALLSGLLGEPGGE